MIQRFHSYCATVLLISVFFIQSCGQPSDWLPDYDLLPVEMKVDSAGEIIRDSPPHDMLAQLDQLNSTHYKWGAINKYGEIIIDPKFDYLGYFFEGLAVKQDSFRFGYVNEQGQTVIKSRYSRATAFSEGLAAVTLQDSSIVYIDNNDVERIRLPFARASYAFAEGYAVYQAFNNKYGAIDKSGKVVIQPKYDFLNRFSEGLARFWIKDGTEAGQYGFIDKHGKIVIDPQSIEFAGFVNGLSVAIDKKTGKYGYVDKSGEFAIAFRFDSAFSFSADGLARANLNGKWGYIDTGGRMRIEAKFQRAFGFHEGLAVASLTGNEYGIIDINGKWVCPPIYKEMSGFRGGLAAVKVENGVSFVNHEGDLVSDEVFNSSLDFPPTYNNFPDDFYIETDQFDVGEVLSALFTVSSNVVEVQGLHFGSTLAEAKTSVVNSNKFNIGGFFGPKEISQGYFKQLRYGDISFNIRYQFDPGNTKPVTVRDGLFLNSEYPNAVLTSVDIEVYDARHLKNRLFLVEEAIKNDLSKRIGARFSTVSNEQLKQLEVYEPHLFVNEAIMTQNKCFRVIVRRHLSHLNIKIIRRQA